MQVCIVGACPTSVTVTRFRPTIPRPISDHLSNWFHARARIQASRPSDSSRAHEFGPYSPNLDPYFSPNLRIHPECSFRAACSAREHVVAHKATRANLTRASPSVRALGRTTLHAFPVTNGQISLLSPILNSRAFIHHARACSHSR